MRKQPLIVNKLSGNKADMFLYGEIGSWDGCISSNDFVKELRLLERDKTDISLRMNSGGGGVYEGIAIFNAVKGSKAIKAGYIDGIAASMCSLIAMACPVLYMSRFARLMTHLPSGGAFGTAEDMRAVADELDALGAIGNEMYRGKTGLSESEVYAKFLNGKDSYFSAKLAKEAKLIDDIYDGEEMDMPDDITDKGAFQAFNTRLVACMQHTNETQPLIII